MADITTNIAGLELENPTILASGILGQTGESLLRIINEGGAGAVVTKSIGSEPRTGHGNPCVLELDQGILNAMGLPNPGIDEFGKEVIIELSIVPEKVCESVMIEQPIPSVMEVSQDTKNQLKEQFDHFEIKNDTVCIFVERLDESISIQLPLQVNSTGKCLVEGTRLYEMYNPLLECQTAASTLITK